MPTSAVAAAVAGGVASAVVGRAIAPEPPEPQKIDPVKNKYGETATGNDFRNQAANSYGLVDSNDPQDIYAKNLKQRIQRGEIEDPNAGTVQVKGLSFDNPAAATQAPQAKPTQMRYIGGNMDLSQLRGLRM